MSHGSAAAIPTPTLERASKAFRCLPTSRLLAADLAGSGLGASTNATELAAKTVPAMGEVIAFPTRLSVLATRGRNPYHHRASPSSRILRTKAPVERVRRGLAQRTATSRVFKNLGSTDSKEAATWLTVL